MTGKIEDSAPDTSASTAAASTAPASTWECFATAVHFLTRITVSSSLATRQDFDHAAALNRSVVFFPLVGGLIGVFTASVLAALLSAGIPPLLASFLALGLEAYFTGAFHEDAFADTCDAFGGGWTRERVLEIIKDSRLGTYGVIALVLGVGSRGIAMAATTHSGTMWAVASIVAAAMLARLTIVVFMITTAPIENRQSPARDVSGTQPASRVASSVVLAFPFALLWLVQFPGTAALSLIVCIAIIAWYRRLVLRLIGGTTGDVLGASGFLAQLVIITGASAA